MQHAEHHDDAGLMPKHDEMTRAFHRPGVLLRRRAKMKDAIRRPALHSVRGRTEGIVADHQEGLQQQGLITIGGEVSEA